jgi:hypothetical protein
LESGLEPSSRVRDPRLILICADAVWELDIPAAFVIIDPNGNLANSRWMLFPIAQDNEVGAKLGN